MNYVSFHVTVLNRVGDVEPDVDGKLEHILRIVGPVKSGKTHKDAEHHFALDYACNWETFRVDAATIEWADGLKETIDNSYMQMTKGWKRDD